jgi:hypothetical protein
MNSVKFLALIASTMLLLSACSNDAADPSSGPPPTDASKPKPTVVSPEDRNSQQVGAADYALKVSAVEDPAKAVASYKPKLANSRLVAIQVSLENIKSKDALDVNAANLKLISESGQPFDSIKSVHEDEIKTSAVKAGESAKGWVAFEVPKDTKIAKVKYLVGLLATVQLEAPLK